MDEKVMSKKIKLLEICPFSAGICGVWARALSESREFQKLGYEVRIFSSDIIKGTHETASCGEDSEGISITRFSANKSQISENVVDFSFKERFLEFKPDIVITHLLHPHSFKALNLCKKHKIPCYLVTHAPFNVNRGFFLNIFTNLYNSISVKPKINNFTKIISITKWERPYLLNLGAKPEKIIYIPNGLPDEFFSQKKTKKSRLKDALFLGRIAPVKNLECLLKAAKKFPRVNFSIVGKAEEKYIKKLKAIIEKNIIPNIAFYSPVTELDKKIKLIDEHKIFVLPSSREAMPQVLIEAMARGKIVLATRTDGGKELIEDGKTGFLFEINDSEGLSELISKNLKGNKQIEKNAELFAQKFAWKNLIKSYVSLFNSR